MITTEPSLEIRSCLYSRTSINAQLVVEDLDTSIETVFFFKVKNVIGCQEMTLSSESLNPQALTGELQKRVVSFPNADI